MAGITKAQQIIWSKEMQAQLDTLTSLRKHCDFKYEKDSKNAKQVKIIGAIRPTIKTYVPGTPLVREQATDSELVLNLDQFKYFDFDIDDTISSQSIPGLIQVYSDQATKGLAEEGDKYVADLVKSGVEAGSNPLASNGTSVAVTKANSLGLVEDGFTVLYDNNCKVSDTYHLELCAKFFTSFRQNLTELYTENVEMAKKGYIGKYGNALVSIENNLSKSSAGDIYNILRTNKAIAFAEQINKVEKFRPQDGFSDAIKGLYTYGALIVRPEQIYVIKTK